MAIPAAAVDATSVATSDPVNTLDFLCKCGCELFRCYVSVYADGCWSESLICISCGASCQPTQPILNGLH